MTEKTSTPDEPESTDARTGRTSVATDAARSGGTEATAAIPASAAPVSGAPMSGAPTSGAPVPATPRGTERVEEDEQVDVPLFESATPVTPVEPSKAPSKAAAGASPSGTEPATPVVATAPGIAEPGHPAVDPPTEAVETVKPVDTKKPAETKKPVDTKKPVGTTKSRPAAARPSPAARPAADDTPTQEVRIPAGVASGRGGPSSAPPADGATTRLSGPRAGAGAPAPGSAPDTTNPPPWHRVPGPDGTDGGSGRADPRRQAPMSAGVLLDEGPTAFLEVAGGRQESSPPPGEEQGGFPGNRAVRNRPPRQAALQLKRLDPWSALKLALVLSVVLFFVWMVAVGVLYGVLDGIGVWDRLNGTYADIVSGEAPSTAPLISAGRVFGLAAVLGAINSLLFAVAMTIGAFVYNVSADLVGGVEVTLSERD